MTAAGLRACRKSFATTIPVGGNHICHARDRVAVLDIYKHAIQICAAMDISKDTLKSTRSMNLAWDVRCKIQTVLALRPAPPDDPVFRLGGSRITSPLDPTYAEPRIDHSTDEGARQAQWRRSQWIANGWPRVYPKEAVAREDRDGLSRGGALLYEWISEVGWNKDYQQHLVHSEPEVANTTKTKAKKIPTQSRKSKRQAEQSTETSTSNTGRTTRSRLNAPLQDPQLQNLVVIPKSPSRKKLKKAPSMNAGVPYDIPNRAKAANAVATEDAMHYATTPLVSGIGS